jgi:soluble lytic murein transglycosylase-like protein
MSKECRRSGPRRPLVLVAAAMLFGGAALVADPAEASPVQVAPDTVQPPPFSFRKTVFFTPEYLSRFAEAARQRNRSQEIQIEVHPPVSAEEPRAATYARRFGIPRDLAQKIIDTAHAEGLDPELGFRLIRVESRFSTQARGPQGALGLTQLMPGTARWVDRSLATEAQILDPSNNLRVGFRYLRRMIERYDGDVRLGLLAYNRGERAVDRALKSGGNPENGYSHKVLGTKGSNPYRGRGLTPQSP